MRTFDNVIEDPEGPGWWLCTNGEEWGITHPCPKREDNDPIKKWVWTTAPTQYFCGLCHTFISKRTLGMLSLLQSNL